MVGFFWWRGSGLQSKLCIIVLPIKISRPFFTDKKYNLKAYTETEKIEDSQVIPKQVG